MATKLNARKMLKVLQGNVTEARDALVVGAQLYNRDHRLEMPQILDDLVVAVNRAEALLRAAVGSPDLSDARD